MSYGLWGENVVIFGVDDSSSMHADNKKKLSFLSESPTDRLDDATISAEAKCSINVFKSEKKMWVCITMKVAVFYANGVKMYQFKAKD